ncbi:hypothetical protein [Rhizobium sp. 007]|uniref:hypothetical protein n=1 Tax=Rhizobium sp. 007 TaxID=2785056 RepID=UPI00188EDA82|nr:hypothetical protein [Rhizobium sp. 007]QPB18889.1 hypothetical protein ISN39_14895 [Rhizobium sp. 007]
MNGNSLPTVIDKVRLEGPNRIARSVLTENLAILAYIAHESRTLIPREGVTCWRALEALSFMASEIHGTKAILQKFP